MEQRSLEPLYFGTTPQTEELVVGSGGVAVSESDGSGSITWGVGDSWSVGGGVWSSDVAGTDVAGGQWSTDVAGGQWGSGGGVGSSWGVESASSDVAGSQRSTIGSGVCSTWGVGSVTSVAWSVVGIGVAHRNVFITLCRIQYLCEKLAKIK